MGQHIYQLGLALQAEGQALSRALKYKKSDGAEKRYDWGPNFSEGRGRQFGANQIASTRETGRGESSSPSLITPRKKSRRRPQEGGGDLYQQTG